MSQFTGVCVCLGVCVGGGGGGVIADYDHVFQVPKNSKQIPNYPNHFQDSILPTNHNNNGGRRYWFNYLFEAP